MAGLLVVAFLVASILVPALALAQPRPARFGWQMYSIALAAPRAWTESADGARQAYDLADKLAVLRADIADPRAVGAQICRLTDAAAVLVELRVGSQVRVPCS